MSDRVYDQLATAIVLQAVTDYNDACKVLKDEKTAAELKCGAEKRIASIENFVRSDWYSWLTEIPTGVMLKKLEAIKSGEYVLPPKKRRRID